MREEKWLKEAVRSQCYFLLFFLFELHESEAKCFDKLNNKKKKKYMLCNFHILVLNRKDF